MNYFPLDTEAKILKYRGDYNVPCFFWMKECRKYNPVAKFNPAEGNNPIGYVPNYNPDQLESMEDLIDYLYENEDCNIWLNPDGN